VVCGVCLWPFTFCVCCPLVCYGLGCAASRGYCACSSCRGGSVSGTQCACGSGRQSPAEDTLRAGVGCSQRVYITSSWSHAEQVMDGSQHCSVPR
jgi:hypothetical protein